MSGTPYRTFKFRVELEGVAVAGFTELGLLLPAGLRSLNQAEVLVLPALAAPGAAAGQRKWPNLVLKQGAVHAARIYRWIFGWPRKVELIAGDGSVRFRLVGARVVDGIVAPGGGASLLPAVQKVREAAGRTDPSATSGHVLYQDILIPAGVRRLLPALQAAGGGDVAIEEITIVHEGLWRD